MNENNIVEFEILTSISKLISSNTEGETKFDEIFKLLSRLVPFESASLFVSNGDSYELIKVGDYGGGVDLARNFSFGKGTGLSSYVAEEKRTILLSNLHDGPRFTHGSLKSFLSVPMVVEDNLVGVINFGHFEPEIFNQTHVEYLEIVATQLAGIILQLQYTTKLKDNNKKLEEANAALKEAQEKLIESEKMATLGHITAGINHEINNPLAVISGHVQLLEMDPEGIPDKVMERLRIMMREVDRISDVLRNLQKVKKIALSEYTSDGVHMLDIDKSLKE